MSSASKSSLCKDIMLVSLMWLVWILMQGIGITNACNGPRPSSAVPVWPAMQRPPRKCHDGMRTSPCKATSKRWGKVQGRADWFEKPRCLTDCQSKGQGSSVEGESHRGPWESSAPNQTPDKVGLRCFMVRAKCQDHLNAVYYQILLKSKFSWRNYLLQREQSWKQWLSMGRLWAKTVWNKDLMQIANFLSAPNSLMSHKKHVFTSQFRRSFLFRDMGLNYCCAVLASHMLSESDTDMSRATKLCFGVATPTILLLKIISDSYRTCSKHFSFPYEC